MNTKEKARGDVLADSSGLTADIDASCVSCQSDSIMLLEQIQGVESEITHKFDTKKKASSLLSEVYAGLGLTSRALRVSDCGSFLAFAVSSDSHRLILANFCKDRLCPMCNWRRSLKIFGQVSKVMNELQKRNDLDFLFLTLTIRNCSESDLSCTVQTIFDGWRRFYNVWLRRYKQGSVFGSFRSFEVTYNHSTGEYHPHLHIILAVPKEYFLNPRLYISQAEWAEIWADSCGLDYTPIVHIEKIKPDKNGSLVGAVAEVAKYAVKEADLLSGDFSSVSDRVSAFLAGISRRRLCDFTGCFREVRQQLKLDDIETGDLVFVDDSLRSDVVQAIIRYSWRCGVYVRLD